ncbi:MAG: type II toxin-antitoxin system PemK/MazF family toxin [archaeon]|nr:type II toxin-antitoxin system PemK/MazF family toxin [archaeon]
MNSSIIEQGELVVADIMFAEQDEKKRRLALIISNTAYNKASNDVVVLKVTSKAKSLQYTVNLTNESTIKKALRKDSTIRVDFPITISKQKILARPDKVNMEKLRETKERLKNFYEL